MESDVRHARCALRIRALHKRYRAGVPGCSAEVDVLRGVDLCVRSGELVAVVAPPGGGLTTLLLCAAGLLRPDAGSVTWGGVSRADQPPGGLARGVSLVLGAPFPTVREAVAAPYGVWLGRRGPACAGRLDRLLLVGPQARWRSGGDRAEELAGALRAIADVGAAVLVARRERDAACERADHVLTLRDGRCWPAAPAAWRVDPPSGPA